MTKKQAVILALVLLYFGSAYVAREFASNIGRDSICDGMSDVQCTCMLETIKTESWPLLTFWPDILFKRKHPERDNKTAIKASACLQ